VRTLATLVGILAICALAHAQNAPDAGVAPPPSDAAALSDASPSPDAAPAPATPDASAAVPVDGSVEPDAVVGTSMLPTPSRREDAAWLLVGGALTFVTTGIVLAYAVESTEADLDDLYVTVNGGQPVFDAKTQARYDELVKQGDRLEKLSWISFGVAGGMAIGATVLFWKHRKEPTVTPIVTPNSAGVSVRF
jgi:hypothetical protein